MTKKLKIGILKEARGRQEKRAPLTPRDVAWLIRNGVSVEVEKNPFRVFKDSEYEKRGAVLVSESRKADILVGIKEPAPGSIKEGKIYMLFSHTIKGQKQNMPLLREFLNKRATLIDFERIVDATGKRLVYFGRFAGICGVVDSLHYLGLKLQWQGITTPLLKVKPSWRYSSLSKLKEGLREAAEEIKKKGFDKRITPFIIGITGHGNVSMGTQEALEELSPVNVHPKDLLTFVAEGRAKKNRIYKTVFLREEKVRSKDGKGFYFEEYLADPDRFESNLDKYLPHLNMLVHGSYWDDRYPRLVTKDMIKDLCGAGRCRLEFIDDISCDVEGSVEVTYRTTTQYEPTYTYDPYRDVYTEGHESEGVTVLAIDNLPAQLPKDSSMGFSALVRDYLYQVASDGGAKITDDAAVPAEIRRAVVTQAGRLSKSYQYLRKYLYAR